MCMYVYNYLVNVSGCFVVVHIIVLNAECIQHRLKQFNDSCIHILLLKPTIKYFMWQYKKTHLTKDLQLLRYKTNKFSIEVMCVHVYMLVCVHMHVLSM